MTLEEILQKYEISMIAYSTWLVEWKNMVWNQTKQYKYLGGQISIKAAPYSSAVTIT